MKCVKTDPIKLRISMYSNEPRWPILFDAYQAGCIAYIDYAFAEMLLREHPDCAEEEVGAFLCHLSKSVRAGHLCVKVDESGIKPFPEHLWFEEVSAECPEIKAFLSKLPSAAGRLPRSLLTNVETTDTFPTTPICFRNNDYYFHKYWLFETAVLENLQRLIQSTPHLELEEKLIFHSVENFVTKEILNRQQGDAIIRAGQNCLTIISGGPGTGKTYTAGRLIKLFWESSTQKNAFDIALAAPTGKAAANLQKSLQKSIEDLSDFPPLQAKTLHSLLGVRPASILKSETKLSADVIIVDECSMIDAKLMAQLLSSVKTGSRLILLGDPYQLPPVEAGSLFSDIIAVLRKTHTVELKICLRAELSEMVEFAKAVNTGNFEVVHRLCGESSIIKKIDHLMNRESLLQYTASLFPRSFDQEIDTLWEEFHRFRVLSPLRHGIFGVEEVNQFLFQEMIKRVRLGETYVVPIMIAANDYKLDLFNGESGLLFRKKTKENHIELGDYAIFPSSSGFRRISALLLPKYELSYCLSVHKSQGSEFDDVLLLLPEGSEVFGREVLYTAVTRAKKRLQIWSDDQILKRCLLNKSSRISGIETRWVDPSCHSCVF